MDNGTRCRFDEVGLVFREGQRLTVDLSVRIRKQHSEARDVTFGPPPTPEPYALKTLHAEAVAYFSFTSPFEKMQPPTASR